MPEPTVSPVLDAVYRGKRDVLERLLAAHPALDVFEAAAVGDHARVRELVDADPSLVNDYAPDGFTPLGLAAFFRHPEVVRLLLERGADPAIAAKNQLAVTPLHSAVATDAAPVDVGIVRLLLDAGAPVNVAHLGGGAPLHTAAYVGDAEVVRMLLDGGADPSLRTDQGRTAADIARELGHKGVVAMLEAGS